MFALDPSSGLILPIVGVLGALIGSFVNVVGLRLMREESIVSPGSHCYSCNTPIKPYDNIPILSWLMLRGKCRACKAPIHWQYPVVELVTAMLFMAVFWQFGLSWTTLVFWIVVANLMVVMITDFTEQSIYEINSLGMIPLGLAWSWWHGMLGAWTKLLGIIPMPQTFYDALIAVVLAWTVFFVLNLISRWLLGQDGFGGGDASLLMGFGSFWGLTGIAVILIGGGILQAVVGAPLMVIQWARAKEYKLIAGTLFACLVAAMPYILMYTKVLPMAIIMGVAAICAIVAILLLLRGFQYMRSKNIPLLSLPFGPALIVVAWICMFVLGA